MEDFTYRKMFEDLQSELRRIAECKAELEYLDNIGVPDGNLIFSTYTKRYKRKNGVVSVKQYTNMYLYCGRRKHYISKKANKDGIFQLRVAARSKINLNLKCYMESARFTCNILNSCRPRGTECVDFDALLDEECSNFRDSDRCEFVLSELRCGESGDILRGKDDVPAFKNDIYFYKNERLRSKNELITALCLNESGIPYIAEPKYPGVSNYRSDFALLTGDRRVYIEIAGMMTDPDYEERILLKRRMAVESKIPVVIIDMTDYFDESTGFRRTRLHYDKLKRILYDIKHGIIKGEGEILKAY